MASGLKSFTWQRASHIKNVTNFTYESSSLLGEIREYGYDSFYGIPTQDSLKIKFQLTDSSTPPASYDVHYDDFQTPPPHNAYHHLLFYDSLKRVILDSVNQSTNGNNTVLHFNYDELGHTTIQWLYQDAVAPGGYSINQIDTMFISSGNVNTEINYTFNQGVQYFSYLNTYSYTANNNPLYNPYISNSVGCIFIFSQLGDYVSANLPGQFTRQQLGTVGNTLGYSWVMDGSGKVVAGTGIDNSTLQVVEAYSFSY